MYWKFQRRSYPPQKGDEKMAKKSRMKGFIGGLVQSMMVPVMEKAVVKQLKQNALDMADILGDFAKAFYKKCGVDSLEVMRKAMDKQGKRMAGPMKAMCPGEDPVTVAKFFVQAINNFGLPLEIIEEKENEARIKVPYCVHHLENTSRELCEAMMGADRRMIKTLCPKGKLVIEKTVAEGHPYCELVVKYE